MKNVAAVSRFDIVIGLPRILPADGPYTSAAQRWAHSEACKRVLSRLADDLPNANVRVGVADMKEPRVALKGIDSPVLSRKANALAMVAVESAVADVRRQVDSSETTPDDGPMRRLLYVDEFPGKDRITEYRLTLRD